MKFLNWLISKGRSAVSKQESATSERDFIEVWQSRTFTNDYGEPVKVSVARNSEGYRTCIQAASTASWHAGAKFITRKRKR